ncbi:MAG: tyrosine-type recombinase/integrase [Clostridiales bacterium]|nr:tyrosine-type recombinase/integrase [Clostridiales bacterium]
MEESLRKYKAYLEDEEKSAATMEKYLRDARTFLIYINGSEITKGEAIRYKEYLSQQYAPASVNSMLVALNRYLRFIGKGDCCVKLLKIQRQMFCREEKELTKEEYQKLVKASEGTRLSFVLQTICGTGIRVSELRYITVEAVMQGKAVVNCKNKTRVIFIPAPLQKLLKQYIKKSGLTTGSVFVSKNGKPLNRSNIWRDMKALCRKAGIAPGKVFPHNLRRLFARTFYGIEKDLVKLADILGHANVNTTRIYTVESGDQHASRMEKIQRLLTT